MTEVFDSVLVANRGEIAMRVLRSAAAAGYRTIAVYSEADATAPHVTFADEAVCIGPAAAQESYLDAERILNAARRTGATAIHPGYGFLSENAAFARSCADAGLVFIGPSPEAIEVMGNKAAAKRRMLEAGVPCVPGFQEADASDEALLAAASSIGLPLMVKAAAGGGGRGMRLVEAMADLPAALEAARSEARNAFGSGELILEKAVSRPRHVEVQVFGDTQGTLLHLGERDCSVQRRHQKVVEEAPCPVLTPERRRAMGDAAVAAARAIGYVGAGTVEFLLADDGSFYFLEMNTRLQVEHPVTECVTGRDLVDLQLRVARGEPIGFSQDDVTLQGHAIEVRLYAEDCAGGFLPASGPVLAWEPPVGEGIRVDHGLRAGLEITPFYDPMIAKVIASGPDRATARRRLLRALRDTVILGPKTNRVFLIDVLRSEVFRVGEATTALVDDAYAGAFADPPATPEDCAVAALIQYRSAAQDARGLRVVAAQEGHGSGPMRPTRFIYRVHGSAVEVAIRAVDESRYEARVGEQSFSLEALPSPRADRLRVVVDGLQGGVHHASAADGALLLQWRGRSFEMRDDVSAGRGGDAAATSGSVLAPMHGNLLHLRVAPGDRVRRGDEVAVIEAMKMEHRLRSAVNGTVASLGARQGEQVAAGALIAEIVSEDEAQA